MNREQIIEMAREAGMFRLFNDPNAPEALVGESIERFAKLVRDDYSNRRASLWLKRIDLATKLAYVAGQLDMRERAAGVCEDVSENNKWSDALDCEKAIRALPIEGGAK